MIGQVWSAHLQHWPQATGVATSKCVLPGLLFACAARDCNGLVHDAKPAERSKNHNRVQCPSSLVVCTTLQHVTGCRGHVVGMTEENSKAELAISLEM